MNHIHKLTLGVLLVIVVTLILAVLPAPGTTEQSTTPATPTVQDQTDQLQIGHNTGMQHTIDGKDLQGS